jgi:hypothetical protein
MGNVCCNGKEESNKASALDQTLTEHDSLASSHHQFANAFYTNGSGGPNSNNSSDATPLSPTRQKQENDRQQALRQEQARLEIIVQATGQSMVATSKGSLPYYNDQGFAAALSQHLEQTTTFPQHITRSLPDFPKEESIYARLSTPGGGGSAAAGASSSAANSSNDEVQLQRPNMDESFMDRAAESFLESVVVKKESLFAGVQPIVENLL